SVTQIEILVRRRLAPLDPPAWRTKSSKDWIKYDLYPCEQGKEVRLRDLYRDVTFTQVFEDSREADSYISKDSLKQTSKEIGILPKDLEFSYSWHWKEKNLDIAIGVKLNGQKREKTDCIVYVVSFKKTIV